MRALVKARPEPGLWLEDVPEPEVGINEVLIHVRKTGICGTDLHIYDWNAWAQETIPAPMVIGHEAAGIVDELGRDVTDLAPGDHVVFSFVPMCGRCAPCLSGRPALCERGARANSAGTLRLIG